MPRGPDMTYMPNGGLACDNPASISVCDEYEYDVEYPGGMIECHRKPSSQQCQEFCQTFSNCVGWEWGSGGDLPDCCAKSQLLNRGYKPGIVAGARNACHTSSSGGKGWLKKSNLQLGTSSMIPLVTIIGFGLTTRGRVRVTYVYYSTMTMT